MKLYKVPLPPGAPCLVTQHMYATLWTPEWCWGGTPGFRNSNTLPCSGILNGSCSLRHLCIHPTVTGSPVLPIEPSLIFSVFTYCQAGGISLCPSSDALYGWLCALCPCNTSVSSLASLYARL
ncbi:hypothetical protein GDO78_017694 [Eleutherodactylus coqui]|uniref:Uncharacterized protein n=1 Tax=Eleutherodactylus coqui TaxID=57060 RepID=A0A8J6BQQ9_ELECQ|nr:hypothetical protein GDO78_017694 [Eleutherodactylus coqui]